MRRDFATPTRLNVVNTTSGILTYKRDLRTCYGGAKCIVIYKFLYTM